jgi:hypothetical protein
MMARYNQPDYFAARKLRMRKKIIAAALLAASIDTASAQSIVQNFYTPTPGLDNRPCVFFTIAGTNGWFGLPLPTAIDPNLTGARLMAAMALWDKAASNVAIADVQANPVGISAVPDLYCGVTYMVVDVYHWY